jgi:hypothetical protein
MSATVGLPPTEGTPATIETHRNSMPATVGLPPTEGTPATVETPETVCQQQ